MDLVVANRVALVWGVGEAVLVAQFFLDLRIDCVDGFFFGDFEHAAAGFLGDLFEDFLALGALLLRRSTPPPPTPPPPPPPTSPPTHTPPACCLRFGPITRLRNVAVPLRV